MKIEGMNTSGRNLASHYLNIALGTDNIPVFAYYDENANRPILSKLTGVPGVQQNSISIDYREEVDYLVDTGIVDLSDAPMGIHTSLAIGPSDVAYVMFLDETAPSGTGNEPETQMSMRNDISPTCAPVLQ